LEAFNILTFLSQTNYLKIKYERIGSRTALTESKGEAIAAFEVSYGCNIRLPFNGGFYHSVDMCSHVQHH
jgi:hypothetical protein